MLACPPNHQEQELSKAVYSKNDAVTHHVMCRAARFGTEYVEPKPKKDFRKDFMKDRRAQSTFKTSVDIYSEASSRFLPANTTGMSNPSDQLAVSTICPSQLSLSLVTTLAIGSLAGCPTMTISENFMGGESYQQTELYTGGACKAAEPSHKVWHGGCASVRASKSRGGG